MTILDRYVLKKFLMPFLYCIVGFIAIWFIFDFSDNLPNFLQGKAGLPMLLQYYRSQLPFIIVLSIPAGALLALLYSLTAMSRSNEIISMLTAGRSVVRVMLPLFFAGLLLVAITTYFNWSLAPHADRVKKQMLSDIRSGQHTEDNRIFAHMFRNRADYRLWFMRRILPERENEQLQGVQIIQQNEANDVVKEWFSEEATYDPIRKAWILKNARSVELDPQGNILKSVDSEEMVIDHWSETPQRIASSVLNPDFLSVPELREYLIYNRDFPERRLAPYRTHLEYRYALPWQAMLAVVLAGPLGIVYSRRGILGGVATAIGLFFSMIFVDKVFIALGKGNHMSPFLAAWTPLTIYFLIGFGLLWMRSTNRDFSKLKIPGLT